ncbi:uncharacterized protein LOC111865872 isoform X2 [Cryptotermes secundus]|uniref:uncharacterized protein LOC111865872 isoform X2 n=1 Tax=Cryptotermes secundus TaxID=105785 RepID=UPI001454BC21|nr:uncharacterized protein LOC111865872 isoform X2 [Cryptotermes secundus]
MGLAACPRNVSHAEVLAAATSVFCRQNRTPYRCIFPNISERQLDLVLLAAWDSSPETEKNIYISEVLDIFGTDGCKQMINPGLGNLHSRLTATPQLAPEAASPSGRRANKRPHFSAFTTMKTCSGKRRWMPAAQEVETMLLDGFAAEEIDEASFIFRCILEEPNVQFDSDFEYTWEPEEILNYLDQSSNFWISMPTLDDLLFLDNEV